MPTATTLPAPQRSATMPASGCSSPQRKCCMPIARAKIEKDQPRSRLIGSRKTPKLKRVPMLTDRPRQPATRDRKSVVKGKSVYDRVDLGGRRHIKKKTNKK